MPQNSRLRNHSKMYSTPRRPFVGSRIKSELELMGKSGLRNKQEIYKAKFMLSNIRSTAKNLLTLEESNPKRKFEGEALLRRLHTLGILDQEKNELDYILALKVEDVLKRRLQSVVVNNSIAKSAHQARVYIRQGHIKVGDQKVDIPSFMVRTSSEQLISLREKSPYSDKTVLGRKAKKHTKAATQQE